MGEQEAASGIEDCTEPAGGCFVFSYGIGTVVGKWMKVGMKSKRDENEGDDDFEWEEAPTAGVRGSGFGVRGPWFRGSWVPWSGVRGTGYGVRGSLVPGVQGYGGTGLRGTGYGVRVSGFGFRIFGFGVQRSGFGFKGLGV
ncbi:hypothetical protein VitviT2T_022724 [Vitis vinifera]|uniref:Uncharacterized protein n=1 Tax=Vitis vinifera TaxID=29760 RepID=A0ABY9DAN5_VITVI|nr:hypothetical protein VitviT2T_022724 [Vitis vinifera]